VRPTFVKQYDEAFSRVDILAMPTVGMKAPVYREPKDHEEALEHTLFGGQLGMDLGSVVRNTCPFNLTGHPAISIPCGKSEGLPIGLMLVAPHFREGQLLSTAYTYQHSVNWASLFPSQSPAAEDL
ncbi:MAG: amidase family protein, partial [Candidatus Binatia bacterium]